MRKKNNKGIIKKLIKAQICPEIFNESISFKNYFSDETSCAYKIINAFYTNFGLIERIAFPDHHKLSLQISNTLYDEETSLSPQYDDNEEEIFIDRHSISYNKIPFDLCTIISLECPDLLIHWLKIVQTSFGLELDCISDDGMGLFIDIPFRFDSSSSQERHPLIITQIVAWIAPIGCIYDPWYPLNSTIIEQCAHFETPLFQEIMTFVLKESYYIDATEFLVHSIPHFIEYEDIGCANYRLYLEHCSLHDCIRSFSNPKELMLAITGCIPMSMMIYDDVRDSTFSVIKELIWRDYGSFTENSIKKAANNEYYQIILNQIGRFISMYALTDGDSLIQYRSQAVGSLNLELYLHQHPIEFYCQTMMDLLNLTIYKDVEL